MDKLYKIFLVSSWLILIYYFFIWEIDNNLYSFFLFIFSLVLYFVIFAVSLIRVFRQDYKFLKVILILALFLILPLKSYYVDMKFYLNKKDLKSAIEAINSGKIELSNENFFKKYKIYKFPKKVLNSNRIYKGKNCLYFSLYSYLQLIAYCKDEKILKTNRDFLINKKLGENFYWVSADIK